MFLLLVMLAQGPAAQAEDGGAGSAVAAAGALLRDPGALAAWVRGRSSEVAAVRFQAVQARAQADMSRLLPNPVLDGSLANVPIGETTPRNLGLRDTAILGVGLSQTIELGKRGPRREAAELRARAATVRIDGFAGNRIADARLALGRAIYAASRSRTLTASLSAARASTDVIKGRLQHQAVAGVDYDRLLLDLTALQAEVTRGEAEARATRSLCAAALLAPCDLDAATADDLEVPLPPNLDVEQLHSRSDVVSLNLERAAAGQDATLAARRAIPDVTARVGYTRDAFIFACDSANTVAVSLSIPVPLFDHGRLGRAAALARADELAQNTRGVLQEARGDIAALSARRQALEQMLATLTGGSVPRAKAVLAAQEQGLLQGQVDTTDLLLARRQALGLELQILDLRFELFTTKSELRRALGSDETGARNG